MPGGLTRLAAPSVVLSLESSPTFCEAAFAAFGRCILAYGILASSSRELEALVAEVLVAAQES
jgi:hypothetical protein